MADDILTKIKNGEAINSGDVQNSTEGLKALNEGYIPKNYTLETSTKETPNVDKNES